MQYISTRGRSKSISFQDAAIVGQAPDGGLFVPSVIPKVDKELARWKDLSFQDLAFEIMQLYASDIPAADLKAIIARSYATFDCPEVTPVKRLRHIHVVELWHGPTLAFKDVALQFLSNVFEYILRQRKATLNILGATSGDTGSAAIHGVKGKENINIFIMHPNRRTSQLQALQMTTVLEPNVFNIAVEGTFDDCQNIMKTVFNDASFKERYHLGAINSINWARILAQIVYYFYAYFRVHSSEFPEVNFCVPTGNFGDIFAGYVAKRMGLPVHRLVLATNENDILAKFFRTGDYSKGEVNFTISPSMDIQVASNFERYLFYRCNCDGAQVTKLMEDFGKNGSISLPVPVSGEVDPDIIAGSGNTAQTLATIQAYFELEGGYLLDPHTAVGVAVAEQLQLFGRTVCLATAHPAKFPDAIEQATKKKGVATHPVLQEVLTRESRCEVLPNSVDRVKAYVMSKIKL